MMGDICLGGGVIEKTFIGEIEHSKHVYEHIHG